MQEFKYHFTYIIINLVNFKYYIGVHSTNDLNDKYLGSGKFLKRAINKYGRNNFIRVIVEHFATRDLAFDSERTLITKEMISSNNCYNFSYGGNGCRLVVYKYGKDHHGYGKKCPEHSARMKGLMVGNKNPMFGKRPPEHVLEAARKVNKGKKYSKERCLEMSNRCKGKLNIKIILDTENGVYYSGVEEATKYNKYSRDYIYKMLRGRYTNKTSLIYV